MAPIAPTNAYTGPPIRPTLPTPIRPTVAGPTRPGSNAGMAPIRPTLPSPIMPTLPPNVAPGGMQAATGSMIRGGGIPSAPLPGARPTPIDLTALMAALYPPAQPGMMPPVGPAMVPPMRPTQPSRGDMNPNFDPRTARGARVLSPGYGS